MATVSRTHRNDDKVTIKGVEVWRIGGRRIGDATTLTGETAEFYGPKPVWERCYGEKNDARENHGDWKCAASCDGLFDEDEMIKGKPSWESGSGMFPPPHLRLLTIYEQADAGVTKAIKAAGFDPHSESIREAVFVLRDHGDRRNETLTSMRRRSSSWR